MKFMKNIGLLIIFGMLAGIPLLGLLSFVPVIPAQVVENPNTPVTVNAWQNGGITINGNSDLIAYNMSAGADGTLSKPYVIANLSINATGGIGINIYETNAYFLIENCTIMNASTGINLYEVTNGRLFNNTIYDCTGDGIHLRYTNQTSIEENTIYDNCNGIYLEGTIAAFHYGTHYNDVTDNTIYQNVGTSSSRTGNGIVVFGNCTNNLINLNEIYDNTGGSGNYGGNGVFIMGYGSDHCDDNDVLNNNIYDNTGSSTASGNGIVLYDFCDYSNVNYNTIHDVTGSGFRSGNGIWMGGNSASIQLLLNTANDNTIYNCYGTNSNSGSGIYLHGNNVYTMIDDNTIYNCYGPETYSGCGVVVYGVESSGKCVDVNVTLNEIHNITGGDNYYSGIGVFVHESDGTEVSQNTIYDITSGDADYSGNGIWAKADDNTIDLNTVYDITGGYGSCTGNGIGVVGESTDITNNNVYNIESGGSYYSGNGIYFDDSGVAGGSVTGNSIKNTFNAEGSISFGGAGIYLADADSITATGNTVLNSQNHGMLLWYCSGNTVTGNTICFYGEECVRQYSSSGNTVSSNKCEKGDITWVNFQATTNPGPGTVDLEWTAPAWANSFRIYRSTSEITSGNVRDLTPIVIVSTLDYTDQVSASGDYYYAIIPFNTTDEGPVSIVTTYVFIMNTPQVPGFELVLVIMGLVAFAGLALRHRHLQHKI